MFIAICVLLSLAMIGWGMYTISGIRGVMTLVAIVVGFVLLMMFLGSCALVCVGASL